MTGIVSDLIPAALRSPARAAFKSGKLWHFCPLGVLAYHSGGVCGRRSNRRQGTFSLRGAMARQHRDEGIWLIWSIEHESWWGPARHGYTWNRETAGRYTLEEATEIVRDSNKMVKPGGIPEESMVPAW